MSNYTPEIREPKSPLKAIADWVRRYREAIGVRGELAMCGTEEVASVARDIAVEFGGTGICSQKRPPCCG